MKYLSIIITSFLLLIGCGDKNKETTSAPEQKNKYAFDTSDIKATPIQESGKNYNLQYEFEKNKIYKYRISTISADFQKVSAKDTTLTQIINQSGIYLTNLNLINIDKDGIIELGCTISSIKLDVHSNQNSVSYESGVTPDSLVKKNFAEYDALVNNEFNLRVSKYGEVSEVFKVDNIVNKYLKMKGMSDSLNSNQKNQLRMQISESVLKPLMIQIFKRLPEKAVAADSSWSFTNPPVPLMAYQSQNTTTYKLTGLQKSGEDKFAVIEQGLITKLTGSSSTTNNGIVYSFKKPVTRAEGKIYFNLSKGLVQKSKSSTKINISFSMEMQTPQGKQKQNREEETTTTNVVELL